MKKKSLVMLLSLSMVLSTSVTVFAAETKNTETGSYVLEQIDQKEIQSFMEGYFSELYDTIRRDSEKDYSSTDFISVRGYIVSKLLVHKRQASNMFSGGIIDVTIDKVVLEDLSEFGNIMEAMVYVNYSYTCANDLEPCYAGILYRVTLSKTEDGYQVLDLDNKDMETLMAKNAILGESEFREELASDLDETQAAAVSDARTESDCFVADAYFEQLEKNTDSLLQDISFAETEEDDKDDEISPLSTSVSYTARKARNWGFKLGDNEQNYIFKRASLDCTNFVSQCVWSGYGGIEGYTIPANPTVNNSTCVALKNRVKSDYRMTSTWYGRNYDSTLGDPPTSFCGVVGFCNYVSTNTGDGPKATVYNDGKVFSSLSVKLKQGDVLQFYSNAYGRYSHSVIVVSDTAYNVSDYKNVKVAQHDQEYNNRNLSEIIDGYGGSSCKMRLIRFKSTTF